MPGLYRLDLPDVVVDTEAEVIVMLKGAANMAPVAIRITCKKLQTNAVTVADKSGYSLTAVTGLGNQTANITGNLSGSVGSVTAGVTVTTNNDKTGYTLTVTPPTAATIADAVLDELVTQHLTPNSLGWNINIIKKANTVIEGTILASPTPTTTVFRISGADYPTGALEHAVLWMNSGTAQEQNSPILTTVNNGDGTITVTLEEALVTAPVAGDTVLIDPTSHVHAIADIQSGLATAAALATLTGYVDTEVAAIKTVTDRISTGLVQDGVVWQFTANMLELAPAGGGGGGSGDASLANQVLILDQLDVIQNKTDLISGASGITSLLAGAVLDPGSITSFPEVLTVGDSYTEANGRAIQIPIVDTNSVPISSTGSLYFSSATVTFVIKRAGETDSDRIISGTAAFVDPPGTGTGDEAPYAVIELLSSETSKGLTKYKYTGILTFTWPGTSDEVMSFETNTITFRE
jgi:hypothetical protein